MTPDEKLLIPYDPTKAWRRFMYRPAIRWDSPLKEDDDEQQVEIGAPDSATNL